MDTARPCGGGVLIVEDDRAIRETLAEILTDEGYPVNGAANGHDAITYLRSRPRPQLILLDLMMPVMNGWEFRREQLADPQLAEIPVVVITGDTSAGERASALGVAEVIAKPIDLAYLLRVVRHHCARAG